MKGIDAIIMGRNTFEIVCGFDIPWPYNIPVFVLSNKLQSIDEKIDGVVEIVNGPLSDVLAEIYSKGYRNLYIDGGSTIQSFLKENLIDEMIITTIPILLGGGIPLFGDLDNPIRFQCVESKIYLESVVQSKYVIVR